MIDDIVEISRVQGPGKTRHWTICLVLGGECVKNVREYNNWLLSSPVDQMKAVWLPEVFGQSWLLLFRRKSRENGQ